MFKKHLRGFLYKLLFFPSFLCPPTGVFGLSYQDKIYINHKKVYFTDLGEGADKKLESLYKKIADRLVKYLELKVARVIEKNNNAIKEFIKQR